jgi:hypothetical protein
MAAVLTTGASIGCGHGGTVQLTASRSALTVGGAAVLVAGDLTGAVVSGCQTKPTPGGNVPCTAVVSVLTGSATKLTVGAASVLLDTVSGTTNGNPPGSLVVQSPGQTTMQAS